MPEWANGMVHECVVGVDIVYDPGVQCFPDVAQRFGCLWGHGFPGYSERFHALQLREVTSGERCVITAL
jgi:hypothetical protein